MNVNGIEEVVADKGYHSGALVERLKSYEVRSYIPEKQQKGRRNWQGKADEQRAVYQNRRRVRSEYGKSLLRRRGELVERSFAHCYETGGMRRTHLRGHQNILKRQLIHVGALQLELDSASVDGSGNAAGVEKPRWHAFLAHLFPDHMPGRSESAPTKPDLDVLHEGLRETTEPGTPLAVQKFSFLHHGLLCLWQCWFPVEYQLQLLKSFKSLSRRRSGLRWCHLFPIAPSRWPRLHSRMPLLGHEKTTRNTSPL